METECLKISPIKGTPMKILLEPYYFDFYGTTIKIPAGYAFDGLSIPTTLQWLVNMNDSDNIESGLIHDFMYSQVCSYFYTYITKCLADGLLLDNLRLRNSQWRSVIIYLGVHFFGKYSYGKDTNYNLYKKQITAFRKKVGIID